MRRMMIFIDGENLVCRYQAMCAKGHKPWANRGIAHIPDVLVWQGSVTRNLCVGHHIIRATYYTSAVGDEPGLAAVKDQIQSQVYAFHESIGGDNRLAPFVLKKPSKSDRAKGVDIQLTIDVLTHSFNNSVDTVVLMTGDGDFIPLIDEVRRLGKRVFLAAFSSGLNPDLRHRVDTFECLDSIFFEAP